MSRTLNYPKSKKLSHLHYAGVAIVVVGIGMLLAGRYAAEGPLAGLLPIFGGLDLIIGILLFSYRREVSIDLATHVVQSRRWIVFPIRENTFIPGAFDHVEIKGSGKAGYSVYLGGNRSLFIDGPTDLDQARLWARELEANTPWPVLEQRSMDP